MHTSEVLNRAADVIERDGWHQGGYAPDQTEEHHLEPTTGHPVCMMGAIHAAAGAPLRWDRDVECWVCHISNDELDAATTVLEDHVGEFVPHWNDTKDRTAAEVVEAIRAAAVIQAAREEQDAAWATYSGLVTA